MSPKIAVMGLINNGIWSHESTAYGSMNQVNPRERRRYGREAESASEAQKAEED